MQSEKGAVQTLGRPQTLGVAPTASRRHHPSFIPDPPPSSSWSSSLFLCRLPGDGGGARGRGARGIAKERPGSNSHPKLLVTVFGRARKKQFGYLSPTTVEEALARGPTTAQEGPQDGPRGSRDGPRSSEDGSTETYFFYYGPGPVR